VGRFSRDSINFDLSAGEADLIFLCASEARRRSLGASFGPAAPHQSQVRQTAVAGTFLHGQSGLCERDHPCVSHST